VTITVDDTGPGIDLEHFAEDSSLSVLERLLRFWDGSLTVRKRPEGGTRAMGTFRAPTAPTASPIQIASNEVHYV
jgi:hypothetical protein